jgi:hypothetical protein
MSKFTRFCYADAFGGQYKDKPAFIEAILGRLKIEARQDGWPGVQLEDVDWIEKRGEPPIAVIQLRPGHGDVNVADVRIFLADKRKRQFKLVAQEDAA